MALECKIYGESLKTIGQWLKRNQAAAGLTRQMRTTHDAITLVKVSMANVLLDIEKCQGNGNQRTTKDTRISIGEQKIKAFHQLMTNKTKYKWFSQ